MSLSINSKIIIELAQDLTLTPIIVLESILKICSEFKLK